MFDHLPVLLCANFASKSTNQKSMIKKRSFSEANQLLFQNKLIGLDISLLLQNEDVSEAFTMLMTEFTKIFEQRWSRGHKARGQGQGPRTQAQVAYSPKKKKRSSQKFFRRSPKKKKGLLKNFSSDLHKKTFSKNFFKRFTKF